MVTWLGALPLQSLGRDVVLWNKVVGVLTAKDHGITRNQIDEAFGGDGLAASWVIPTPTSRS